jgi:hypothetical protein
MQRLFQKQMKAGGPWIVPSAVDWPGRHLPGFDSSQQDYLSIQPKRVMYSLKVWAAQKVPFESQGPLVIS